MENIAKLRFLGHYWLSILKEPYSTDQSALEAVVEASLAVARGHSATRTRSSNQYAGLSVIEVVRLLVESCYQTQCMGGRCAVLSVHAAFYKTRTRILRLMSDTSCL